MIRRKLSWPFRRPKSPLALPRMAAETPAVSRPEGDARKAIQIGLLTMHRHADLLITAYLPGLPVAGVDLRRKIDLLTAAIEAR